MCLIIHLFDCLLPIFSYQLQILLYSPPHHLFALKTVIISKTNGHIHFPCLSKLSHILQSDTLWVTQGEPGNRIHQEAVYICMYTNAKHRTQCQKARKMQSRIYIVALPFKWKKSLCETMKSPWICQLKANASVSDCHWYCTQKSGI